VDRERSEERRQIEATRARVAEDLRSVVDSLNVVERGKGMVEERIARVKDPKLIRAAAVGVAVGLGAALLGRRRKR